MGQVQILMFDRSEADDNVLCCIFQRAPLLLLLLLLKNCGYYICTDLDDLQLDI